MVDDDPLRVGRERPRPGDEGRVRTEPGGMREPDLEAHPRTEQGQ